MACDNFSFVRTGEMSKEEKKEPFIAELAQQYPTSTKRKEYEPETF